MAIFFLALLFRWFRLAELATFNYDEARDVIAEKEILNGRPTLLGPESLIGDKTIYYGPLHYYLMAPALLASNFDPIGPYFWTGFLGAVTAVILALSFGPLAGLFYAVFPLAVIYNRWAWNPNTIPLFSTLFIIFLTKRRFFLAGIFLGLAFQLHVTALALIFIALFFTRSPRLFAGFLLGILPIILFDLRHQNFYLNHYRDLISFGAGVLGHRSLTWHYFLWTIPLLAIFVSKLPKKIGYLICLISFITTGIWFSAQKINPPQNPFYIRQIARIIALDQGISLVYFNVAAFIAGDTRATAIRYFLNLEGAKPLGISEYDVADHLYVVTLGKKDDVLYNSTYEVAAFKPKSVSKSWRIADVNIYRLEKK